MNWTPIIVGLLFFLVGSCIAILGGRFFKWFVGYKFEKNLNFMAPQANKETSNLSKEEYTEKLPESRRVRHAISQILIILFRIMGALLAIISLFIIIAIILDL